MGLFDSIFGPLFMALRQPMESYIRLETADGDNSLVAKDGSLVSIIRIEGSRQMVGDAEFARIVEQSTVKLGSRFDRPGHALQVFFMRNPDRIKNELRLLLRPSRIAVRNIGLDLGDLIDERQKNLANFTAWEDVYFVLWTSAASLTKSQIENANKERKNIKWVIAENAQYPFSAIEALRTRHKSFVSGVHAGLDELGVQSYVLENHKALQAVRASLYPTRVHENWRACLPGDPIPARAPSSKSDFSDVLWPPLAGQLCMGDVETITNSIVKIDGLLWSGLDMTLAPMDPTPFPQLLSRITEAGVPFRVSFLIEGGGVAGASTKQFAAGVLGFTNQVNKQIKRSLETLIRLSSDEPIVRLRVTFATWAGENERQKLEDQVAALTQAVESWGYCQVSQMAGDPLDAVMSSALGISLASTAPPAIAPLFEVVQLLPWQRASSPFEDGAMLFRTPDGKVWPYQTGTNLTTTWFDLIFAQPGAGKSVLMNTLNLATCLTAGLTRLPYVAILDIGPSSSGLVALLKDGLPLNRRHEAAHYRLRMTHEYAVNPFDTQLGCRYPLPDERSYLVELLTLLATAPGQAVPYDGIAQLAGMVVDEMFRWRDDTATNAEPRGYLPRIDSEVDDTIRIYNIHLPKNPYWWDVVDKMYELELYHIAALAQRHAVPVLTDAVVAARRPQIRSLLEDTKVAGGIEGVINAFERMITSSIREFPILSGVTQFDISSSRVCALDLMDVAPQGDDTADRQTAIMYMLGRHTLVRHWWLGEEMIKNMTGPYKPYHEKRMREIRETAKRLCYDEFHRTTSSRAVRSQVVRDVREGRKWGVQIILSSQLLEDFSDEMVDLATGVWVLGSAVSDRAVNYAVDRFGLSDSARYVMRNRLTGPRAGGAPCLLLLGTNEGRYEQHLINTLGPVELWALSTSAEDVVIRKALYTRLGGNRARQMLAANYPGGSARSEIRRRVQLMLEKGEVESAATSAVIQEIINDLVGISIATPVKITD